MTIQVENPSANAAAFSAMGAGVGPHSLPGVSNASPANLRKWIAARNKVRIGQAKARVIVLGNSKTSGINSGGSGTSLRTQSPPAYMAAALAARGIPASAANVVALADNSFTTSSYTAYNPNLSFGAGWIVSSAMTLGGKLLQAPTAGDVVTALTYTSPIICDNFLVGFAKASNTGSFTTSVNGGAASAATSTVSGVTGDYGFITVPVSRGSGNTLAINRVTGTGDIYIGFILPYDSTVPAVQVINAGWGSSTSSDWASDTQPRASLRVLKTLAPDLTIIKGPTNDYTPSYGPIPLATFRANLEAIIVAAQLSGDCILMAEAPSDPSRQTQAIQDTYNALMKTVAFERGCAFFDVPYRFNGYAAAAAQGYYADVTHELAIGYAEEGYWLGDVLANI